jgi:hypothetical protein
VTAGNALNQLLNLQIAHDLSKTEVVAGDAIARDVHPRAS